MSLRSINELVVHVESFRNIDLFYQGLYFLRFTIYQENSDQSKTFAHPYILTETYKPYQVEQQANNNQNQDNQQSKGYKYYETHIFRPASIVDSQSQFLTKAFFIKFCEEEVEINDLCHFRIEFDLKPNLQQQELTMIVDLMYFDCLNNNGQTNQNSQQPVQQATQQDKIDYAIPEGKVQSTSKFKIKNICNGIHENVQVVFEDQNFCVANVMIHSCIIDYRFRANTLQLYQFAKLKIEERQQLIEGKKQIKQDNQTSIWEQVKNRYGNVDYEFVYKLIVDNLKQQFEKLYDHYYQIFTKCIIEKQKKHFKKYLSPPLKLIYPEFVPSDPNKNFKHSNEKIEERYHSKDPETIMTQILNEANLISCQIFLIWFKVLDLYKISPRFCVAFLQYEKQKIFREKWNQFLIKENPQKPVGNQKIIPANPNLGQEHQVAAKKQRELIFQKNTQFQICIEDLNQFPQVQVAPIVFEQCIQGENKDLNEENIDDGELNSNEVDNYKGIHLIVLVHGFQGNSYDMKLFENYINLEHPEDMFLCPSANEDNTEGNIVDMGVKLANEIINFVNENCPENTLGRLSLIGHSLGGLIIRSALPKLEQFKDKFHTYMSLSSPHLGYMFNQNKIIDAGMWILKQWKKCACLKELSMDDNSNVTETYLYKLASTPGLGWFKNVAFFSSFQDSYAPYDSARIETPKEALENLQNNQQAKQYIQMVQNLQSQFQGVNTYRFDVNFEIKDMNLDSFIGRTAHILFLESYPLLKLVVQLYDQFFN